MPLACEEGYDSVNLTFTCIPVLKRLKSGQSF